MSTGGNGVVGGGDDAFSAGSIGLVKVSGAIASSSIAAGANPGFDGTFGTADDRMPAVARSASSLPATRPMPQADSKHPLSVRSNFRKRPSLPVTPSSSCFERFTSSPSPVASLPPATWGTSPGSPPAACRRRIGGRGHHRPHLARPCCARTRGLACRQPRSG